MKREGKLATEKTTQHITLEVTEEQRSVIQALFAHNDWDFIVISEKYISTPKENLTVETPCVETDTSVSIQSPESHCNDIYNDESESSGDNGEGDGHGGGDGGGGDNGGDLPALQDGHCHMCLCNPCITQNRQAWLGNGQNARPGNNLIRKDKYKKFWKLLDTRGTWQHPVYIRRKQHALSRDDEQDVWTLREIMPTCVLQLVRSLYPNPLGVPYMGHKWT